MDYELIKFAMSVLDIDESSYMYVYEHTDDPRFIDLAMIHIADVTIVERTINNHSIRDYVYEKMIDFYTEIDLYDMGSMESQKEYVTYVCDVLFSANTVDDMNWFIEHYRVDIEILSAVLRYVVSDRRYNMPAIAINLLLRKDRELSIFDPNHTPFDMNQGFGNKNLRWYLTIDLEFLYEIDSAKLNISNWGNESCMIENKDLLEKIHFIHMHSGILESFLNLVDMILSVVHEDCYGPDLDLEMLFTYMTNIYKSKEGSGVIIQPSPSSSVSLLITRSSPTGSKAPLRSHLKVVSS